MDECGPLAFNLHRPAVYGAGADVASEERRRGARRHVGRRGGYERHRTWSREPPRLARGLLSCPLLARQALGVGDVRVAVGTLRVRLGLGAKLSCCCCFWRRRSVAMSGGGAKAGMRCNRDALVGVSDAPKSAHFGSSGSQPHPTVNEYQAGVAPLGGASLESLTE
jgi:hypothetical protein